VEKVKQAKIKEIIAAYCAVHWGNMTFAFEFVA